MRGSKPSEDVEDAYRFLEQCNLVLFQLDNHNPFDYQTPVQSTRILEILSRHTNLTALSLTTDVHIAREDGLPPPIERLMPNLQAFQLDIQALAFLDTPRLELLLRANNLRILRLDTLPSVSTLEFESLLRRACKACQGLRHVFLGFENECRPGVLQILAQNCPLLQILGVANRSGESDWGITEYSFFVLIDSLHDIEYLEMDATFTLPMSGLVHLASRCPHLEVLNLPRARLRLVPQRLHLITRATKTLTQLTVLRLRQVWFENAEICLNSNRLMSRIAAAWRRMLPNVREIPCRDDVGRMGKVGPDVPLEPRLGNTDQDVQHLRERMLRLEREDRDGTLLLNDFESHQFLVREKLWGLLRYDRIRIPIKKTECEWQARISEEIIGWPLVDFVSFVGRWANLPP